MGVLREETKVWELLKAVDDLQPWTLKYESIDLNEFITLESMEDVVTMTRN